MSIIKKSVVFFMSLIMVLTMFPLSRGFSFAEEEGADSVPPAVEQEQEATEGQQASEEVVSEPSPAAQEETKQEEKEQTEQTEAVKQSEDEITEEESPEQSKTEYRYETDRLEVKAVLSDPEIIPDDAKLFVTPITDKSKGYNYDAYMQALNQDAEGIYNDDNTLLYDIAFIKDGKEIQPTGGTVSVAFDFKDGQLVETLGAVKASDITVTHLPLKDKIRDKYNTTKAAKKIEAEDVKKEEVKDKDLSVSIKDETVEFETKSFSAFAISYTVDFEYNGYKFTMPGEGSIWLSDLFEQLNIKKKVSDVENVTFSDETLVGVKKKLLGSDWKLTSKKAFRTEETLTVQMTDGTIVIKVTDAQAYQYSIRTTDGNAIDAGADYASNWYLLSTLTKADGGTYYYVKPIDLNGSTTVSGSIDTFYNANLQGLNIGNESSYSWGTLEKASYEEGDTVKTELVHVSSSADSYNKIVNGEYNNREGFGDKSVINNYSVSSTSSEGVGTITLTPVPDLKLKSEFKNSSGGDYEGNLPSDYKLLIKMVRDGYTYYALQPVNTDGSTSDAISFYKYTEQWGNGSLSTTPSYYSGNGSEKISTQVVTGAESLTVNLIQHKVSRAVFYNENTIGGTQNSDLTKDLFSSSSAIEDVSGTNVMTTTFTHRKDDGVDHNINVSLYKEHKQDISEAVLYPHDDNMNTAENAYFFRVRLYNNEKLVGYKIVPVTTAEATSANDTGKFTHTIKATDTFQLVDDKGVDIAGGVLHYDPTVYTSDVRLYKAKTAGQLPANLNEVKDKGTDELDGFDFWMNNLDQANNKTDIALYKAYKKIYQVKIEIEGNVSPTSSDAIGMYDEATHQTSNPDKLNIGDISAEYNGRSQDPVGGNTIITYIIEDQTTSPEHTYHWTEHGYTELTGNETFTLYLKQNNKEIVSGYPITIGGDYYDVSYDTGRVEGKNIVYNDTDDVTTITHFIKLTKAQYDSAIGPYDVLGEGAEYGVVADTYIRKDHTETNFAVNHYTEDTAAGIDLAANTTEDEGSSQNMPFYVGDFNSMRFTNNTKVNPDIYTPSNSEEPYVHDKNNSDEAKDKIHQDGTGYDVTVYPTSPEDVSSYVSGLISKLTASSNTYKDKPSVKVSGREVDTTMFPDNVTIYIDASDLNIGEPGWTIKKLKGQSIVFNIPGNKVTIAKEVVSVYERDENGNLKVVEEGIDANTGGNGGNPAKNKAVEDYILNHITFNAYEASYVEFTNGPAGLFLAPNADFEETSGSGTGWVATGKTFTQTSSEWHFFRTQRRYKIDGEVEVEKIFGGTNWGDADTFNFSITAKGKKDRAEDELDVSSETVAAIPMPVNTTISIGKNSPDNPASFGSITYEHAGIYIYEVKEIIPAEKDKIPGVTYDNSIYTVKITVTPNGNSFKKTVEIKKDDGSFAAGDTATFTNTHTGDSAEGTATLKIKKALGEGDTWPTGKTATFELTAVTEGAPMPAADGRTVTLSSASTGDFGAITYPQSSAGKTYEYKISETSGFGSGWTKSGDITATVIVGSEPNESGNLPTTVTYSPDNFTVTNDYTATGTANFSAKKAGNAKLGDRTFQFELLDADNKVIDTSAAVKQGETASFKAIPYTLADKGDHVYKIREKLPAEATAENNYTVNGVTYDTTVKEYTVNVSDDENGTLIVKYNGSTEFSTPEFRNDYSTKGKGEVKVKKTLSGREWKNGDSFEFTITPVDDAPAFTPNNITITNADAAAEYTKSFGKVEFTKAGTYEWTVSETHKGETINGVAYDTADKTVTITVRDDGNGNLVADTNSALVQTAEFTNTYSKSGEGEVKVLKNLIGRSWATDDSFEFTITPVGNAPEFTNNTVIIDKDTEGHTKSFGNVTFTEAGTYEWTVSETHKGETINGVAYDTADKTVTIKVIDNGNGKLVADTGSALVQTAAFENNYSAEGEGEIKVKKTLNGRKWNNNDEFKFTLTRGENNAGVETPMPETDGILDAIAEAVTGSQSVTITSSDADYTKSFGKVKFTKAGTYNWTVSEEHKGETVKGIKYDSSDKTVTIVVEDDGKGNLVAKSGTEVVQTAEFTNTYEATGSATLSAKKAGNEDLGDRTFQFELLDAGDNVIETSAPVTQGETATFTTINYDQKDTGEHTYKIREKLPKGATAENSYTVDGVTYDDTVKTVVVNVEDTEEGTLTVTYDGDNKFTTPEFKNSYDAKGSISLTGSKTFEYGNFNDETFTFSVYKKSDFKEASTTLLGGTVDRNELADNEDLQGKKVASATTKGAKIGQDGKATFTFQTSDGKDLEYELSDLTKTEDGYATGTFEYVVVEDIPKNAAKKTVGETTFYYNSERDIKYDATVYPVTITVTDQGDGTLKVVTSDGNTEFGFTNAKLYTKLYLTKSIDKFIAEDTQEEYVDATLVFDIKYIDPLTGTNTTRSASVKFDKAKVTAQTVEVEKIPIDATTVEVKEIYSSNYSPGQTVTLQEPVEGENGYPVWKVSMDNRNIRTNTGSGIINNVGKSSDGKYKWSVGADKQDEPR